MIFQTGLSSKSLFTNWTLSTRVSGDWLNVKRFAWTALMWWFSWDLSSNFKLQVSYWNSFILVRFISIWILKSLIRPNSSPQLLQATRFSFRWINWIWFFRQDFLPKVFLQIGHVASLSTRVSGDWSNVKRLAWTALMWSFSWDFCTKFKLQVSHLSSFIFVCFFFMWFRRLLFLLNMNWQSSQVSFFSFPWTFFMCLFKSLFCENSLLQNWHANKILFSLYHYHLSANLLSCELTQQSLSSRNFSAQIGHVKGFTFWLTIWMCCVRPSTVSDLNPQISQTKQSGSTLSWTFLWQILQIFSHKLVEQWIILCAK